MKILKAFAKTLYSAGILVLSSWIGTIAIVPIAVFPALTPLAFALLFLPVIISACLQFLWEKAVKGSDRKLPSWIHWRDGLTLWIAIVASTLITFTAMCSAVIVAGGAFISFSHTINLNPRVAGHLFAQWIQENEWIGYYGLSVWIASATFLYRYDDWARQRRQRLEKLIAKANRPARPKTKKFIPPDSIDVELGQMKGKLGLTNVAPKFKTKKAKKTKKTKQRSPSPSSKSAKSQKRRSDRHQ